MKLTNKPIYILHHRREVLWLFLIARWILKHKPAMYAPLWYVYNKNVASRWQNPTMYNTLGSSCLCLQAPMIHKLVISLILGMNQQQLKTLCHFYTLNLWWVQIDYCHHLFLEPRTTTTCGDVFLFRASSLGAVQRLAHDQPVTHFFGRVIYTGYWWLPFFFCYQWHRGYKPFFLVVHHIITFLLFLFSPKE
jgi:hypothetical protein